VLRVVRRDVALVVDQSRDERAHHRAAQLRDHVECPLGARHLAGDEQTRGDGGVDDAAADGGCHVDHHREHHAVVHRRVLGAAHQLEEESAHELGSESTLHHEGRRRREGGEADGKETE